MPKDVRVVDLRFHPSLCRGINMDNSGDDDGLALVLQPLNEAGEFVPLAADLMVVALDLSRDEAHAKVGRWNFSRAEVQTYIQPIGASQGIQLRLPWTGEKPQADRVVVFAYYTTEDGRRVVKDQEVLLNNMHRQNTVWVPRASKDDSVRAASGTRPAR